MVHNFQYYIADEQLLQLYPRTKHFEWLISIAPTTINRPEGTGSLGESKVKVIIYKS